MPTVIGADFRVKGDISCDGDIQLEGTVEGNVQSRSLTVGGSGVIQGDVSVETVKIEGKIAGNVRARSVELTSSAHVAGDLLHESLTVASGAFINGHCRRLPASEVLAGDEAHAAAKTRTRKPEGSAEDQLQIVSDST